MSHALASVGKEIEQLKAVRTSATQLKGARSKLTRAVPDFRHSRPSQEKSGAKTMRRWRAFGGSRNMGLASFPGLPSQNGRKKIAPSASAAPHSPRPAPVLPQNQSRPALSSAQVVARRRPKAQKRIDGLGRDAARSPQGQQTGQPIAGHARFFASAMRMSRHGSARRQNVSLPTIASQIMRPLGSPWHRASWYLLHEW